MFWAGILSSGVAAGVTPLGVCRYLYPEGEGERVHAIARTVREQAGQALPSEKPATFNCALFACPRKYFFGKIENETLCKRKFRLKFQAFPKASSKPSPVGDFQPGDEMKSAKCSLHAFSSCHFRVPGPFFRALFLQGVPMLKKRAYTLALACSTAFFAASAFAAEPTIKIGFPIPLTGEIPKVGESSKFAAELYREEVNAVGGLEVGGKKYPLEFIFEDNESKPETAVNVTLKLIDRDKVLTIIGPQSSRQAVPAAAVANDNEVPMITPWSTNPDATRDRPWVFRAAFLDPFQAPVVANFATKQFSAKKAAVLFEISNDYSKGLADNFRGVWEKLHGKGGVVAFESHGPKDQDFSAQLTKMIAAKPDFIFLPENYSFAALIVPQARDLGFKGAFMGSDAWGSAELMKLCGDACKGQFFSTHYAAAGAKGKTKEFIDKYNKKYGYVPDDVAALTWDAVTLVAGAIQKAGALDGNTRAMRKKIRDNLAMVQEFKGITGDMRFDAQGDPIKCAVIVEIDKKGDFTFKESVCPQ
jgi:branched-chain amino acid transport system substrate-binding protein